MTSTRGSTAGCYGKKKYVSYWSASRATKRLNKQFQDSRANHYHCDTCHSWHVGNRIGVVKGNHINHRAERRKYRGRIDFSEESEIVA